MGRLQSGMDDLGGASRTDAGGFVAETERALDDAVARLRSGGLVAFPTETVYGLGADGMREDAIARVYAIKGRPAGNPLILHVSSVEMARGLVREWTRDAEALARAFWPGPLTIVLLRHERVPRMATGGGEGVAVRMARHPLALALIERFGGALVAPSANRSGGVSPTRAEHVRGAFDERDVLVLDGGACEGGIESTVVSLTGSVARVLRPGVIGRDAIERVVDCEVVDGGRPGDAAIESPGMMARHYAPRTPTRLVETSEHGRASADAVVLALTAGWGPAREIPMSRDAAEYARRLYAALLEGDAMGAREILIERPTGDLGGDRAIWEAINDRLARCTKSEGGRAPGRDG